MRQNPHQYAEFRLLVPHAPTTEVMATFQATVAPMPTGFSHLAYTNMVRIPDNICFAQLIFLSPRAFLALRIS